MALDLTGLTGHVNEAIADEKSAIAAISLLEPVSIAIVNQSTVLTDAQVTQAVDAIQIQVLRDFAPIWGKVAKLWTFSKETVVPPAYWQLVITDDADVADALGYHETTASGQPLGKVFAQTTIAAGLNWSVTISHELLEMLVDPWINVAAEFDDATGAPTKFYSSECCDAPEDDQFAYLINGISVSDFVTPAWFMPGMPGPYDFQKHITAPFQLLSGGYIGELDVTAAAGWQQIQAKAAPGERVFANTRSDVRHALRSKPRRQWRRSER